MSAYTQASTTTRTPSWLSGMLWADVGAAAGLALCLAFNMSVTRNNEAATWLGFVVLGLAAGTAGTALLNRRDATRAARRTPARAAVTDLYGLSFEIQQLMGELAAAQKADQLQLAVDLKSAEQVLARIDAQARRLQRPVFPDRVISDELWQTARTASEFCAASVITARMALGRNTVQRRGLWGDASGFARNGLVAVGRTIERLQKLL